MACLEAEGDDHLLNDGLAVLRDWTREYLYSLSPSKHSEILKIFLLASAVDFYGVPKYIHGADMAKASTSSADRSGEDGAKIPLFTDLVNFLFTQAHGSLEAAIGYMRFVELCLQGCIANVTTVISSNPEPK